MLFKIITWLVKLGLLKAPKQHLYVVGIYVMLGESQTLHRVPAEIVGLSKRSAKWEAKHRCYLKVKGAVNKLPFSKQGNEAQYVVETTLMLDENTILKKFTSQVSADSKETAKWKIKDHAKITVKGAIRKDNLTKYKTKK